MYMFITRLVINEKQLRHETIVIVKQSHKLHIINEFANITGIDMRDFKII